MVTGAVVRCVVLRFGNKKGGTRRGARDAVAREGAFPLDDVKEAFRHLLRLLSRTAILAGAGDDLTLEIARLREDARRATLAEDYEDLCDRLRGLELGPALSGLAPAQSAGRLCEAIEAAIPVARALRNDGPLQGLLQLRKDAEQPGSDLPRAYLAHMAQLAEHVGWVRAAAEVFKGAALDLVGTLARLSSDGRVAHARLSELRDGIERAGALDELYALRQALLQEANALVDEATERDARMSNVRQQVDRVKAHVSTLESALADATKMACTDPLTGLGNRRALDQWVARLSRRASPTGVVAVDIDHFKRVNDRYGHAIGDLVIRHLADVMRVELRGDDASFRVGGEEFAMILPSTNAGQAAAVAERVRVRFASEVLSYGDQEIACSISAGATEWSPRQTFKQALDQADKALYAAKKAGRNRVELAKRR